MWPQDNRKESGLLMSKEGNVNGVGSPQENSSSNLDDYTMADFKTSFKIVSSERD